MNQLFNAIINVYSIAILIIIYVLSAKQEQKKTLQNRIFNIILKSTILLLVLDVLSRFDGKPDTIYPIINQVGNLLMFISSPILPLTWFFYIYDQVYQDEKSMRKLVPVSLVIFVANALLVVATQFTGWYYYIDDSNIYHRGSLFLLSVSILVSIMTVSFILIITKRKKIKRNYYFSLVFFGIPPLVCIILQSLFYGISIVLNGIVLSILIVFLNIQNHNMYTDYLTGLYNRKKLDIYLSERINTCTRKKTFSAIMMDLNDFKLINDTFGHDRGDNALQDSAKLLNRCLKINDFIARYGGDEFFIILDIQDKNLLEEQVLRINRGLERYNNTSNQPYKLGFSMGYEVYNFDKNMKAEEFLKHLDKLMYKEKLRIRKANNRKMK